MPREFIPAVQKGIEEAMQNGPVCGFPMVDVEVALFDGGFHPVDSSLMAFQVGLLIFEEFRGSRKRLYSQKRCSCRKSWCENERLRLQICLERRGYGPISSKLRCH